METCLTYFCGPGEHWWNLAICLISNIQQPKRDSSNWAPFDTSALGIHSRSRQGIVEIPSQSSS
jgi:hypothetical protein